jgi:hypothetical protein
MKKVILFGMLFLATVVLNAQNNEEEKEAIKKVIQTAYVEGLQNEGDADKIDLGFHPDFNLLGIGKDNAMWKLPIADWKAKAVKKREEGKLPSDDKKVSVKFQSIDVTGTAAVAKIEFYVGEKLTYIDYISLYKFDDGWKMVNKIFYKLEK